MGEGFRLRVRYSISGRLAYLSHLETIRSMERVIRRAGLPFAITEGFNPHMKVAFGPALPVGAGSMGEYLDVRLREYVAPEDALVRMQRVAPRNLKPIDCFYIEVKADAIDVAYPVSAWRAMFGRGVDVAETMRSLQSAFDDLCSLGYIEVVKKKGRNIKTKKVEFEGRLVEGPKFSICEDCVELRFTTFQGSEGALRPDKFIAAALEKMENPPQLVELVRMELRANGR